MNAETRDGGACGCSGCGCQAHPVAKAAAAMLEQCEAFIRAVPEGAYSAESGTLKGGTIGKHVRHTLDHFRAALAGASDGLIDYDHRERNVPMETEPAEALRAIHGLRGQLLGLGGPSMTAPIRIRVMIGADGSEVELESTLVRELAFASHHAIHHHAMLGVMAAELGVEVGRDFGKAPSTIAFERAER